MDFALALGHGGGELMRGDGVWGERVGQGLGDAGCSEGSGEGGLGFSHAWVRASRRGVLRYCRCKISAEPGF